MFALTGVQPERQKIMLKVIIKMIKNKTKNNKFNLQTDIIRLPVLENSV